MTDLFSGFDLPTSNYYRCPNCWIDICANIKSLAELKVVQYVMRHTWGYWEFETPKTITTDEFMHGRKRRDGSRIDKGTGLSDRGVKDGIRLALKHGYLLCEVDDRDRGRIRKAYRLNMTEPAVQESHKDVTPDRKHLPGDGKAIPRNEEESPPRSEKDTVGKTRGERENPPDAKNHHAPPSSLSPSSSNALLASLTDQEADFWTRYCAISGADYQKLNKAAYAHVSFFAAESLTTDDIQSLYDLAYTRLRALASSRGIPEHDIVPPRLGNLKNVYPDWQASRKQKRPQDREKHLGQTGRYYNSTYERLSGKPLPPLTYLPIPEKRRPRGGQER